jgi:antitoxin component of MazEF toxin-antitoxin module
MKVVKLLAVGTSIGVVVPRDMLRKLGWYKGDAIVQQEFEGTLVLHNPNRHEVRKVSTRKDVGDGRTAVNANSV